MRIRYNIPIQNHEKNNASTFMYYNSMNFYYKLYMRTIHYDKLSSACKIRYQLYLYVVREWKSMSREGVARVEHYTASHNKYEKKTAMSASRL